MSAARPARARSGRRRLMITAAQLVLAAVMLGCWQLLASGSDSLQLTVSTPSGVARWIASWATGGSIAHGNGLPDLGATLRTAALGYLLGAAAGALGGSIVGGWRFLREAVAPFVGILNAFPKIALAPLFVVIFGSSESMQVYFVAASVFFITFYAIYQGVRSINVLYLQNVRVLGASPLWMVRSVYVPATLVWLWSGLRLTAAWSISATVVVEYLTSGQTGMGSVVSSAQATNDVPQVIGGIAVISLVALVADRLLVAAGRRLMRWQPA